MPCLLLDVRIGTHMILRLGYVAMTMNLEDCSPSGTVTVKVLSSLKDEEARMFRLRRIARDNLKNTLRILRFNAAYNIQVYRFTSKLIPLATHPMVEGWDYAGEFKSELKEVGDFVKANNFRVSSHPDHFTLINPLSQNVLDESIKDLDYHVNLYEAMGLHDFKYKLVLHVGGLYKDKNSSINRFEENFFKLPARIKNRIILENDDKSFTAADVLGICKNTGIPMVLDIHHHNCVNNGEAIEDLLPEVFNTWENEAFNPKLHFSSPKGIKEFRSHAKDVDINEFYCFLKSARKVNKDFDVMLEAKNKEQALLKLSNELCGLKGIKRINEGEFEI